MIPEALLTCLPAPEGPDGDYTDNELATYIVRLAGAGQDCRNQLDAVAGLVRGTK